MDNDRSPWSESPGPAHTAMAALVMLATFPLILLVAAAFAFHNGVRWLIQRSPLTRR